MGTHKSYRDSGRTRAVSPGSKGDIGFEGGPGLKEGSAGGKRVNDARGQEEVHNGKTCNGKRTVAALGAISRQIKNAGCDLLGD
jgi:hypothetical protein